MLRLKTGKTRNTVLRLKSKIQNDDEYLALPGAEPVTLVQVSTENLPFGCQCPLCGGLFELPQGLLYRIENDELPDIDSDAQLADRFTGKPEGLGFEEGENVDADFLATSPEPVTEETEAI